MLKASRFLLFRYSLFALTRSMASMAALESWICFEIQLLVSRYIIFSVLASNGVRISRPNIMNAGEYPSSSLHAALWLMTKDGIRSSHLELFCAYVRRYTPSSQSALSSLQSASGRRGAEF